MDRNLTSQEHMDGPITPRLPEYPGNNDMNNPAFVIDMNYLMPFSVMLMILCVLLLILCYLRHRMRQRRQIQRMLRLNGVLRTASHIDEFGQPDRMVMMYPPTYDEALRNDQPSQKPTFEDGELPPPYSEAFHLHGRPNSLSSSHSADHICAPQTVVHLSGDSPDDRRPDSTPQTIASHTESRAT